MPLPSSAQAANAAAVLHNAPAALSAPLSTPLDPPQSTPLLAAQRRLSSSLTLRSPSRAQRPPIFLSRLRPTSSPSPRVLQASPHRLSVRRELRLPTALADAVAADEDFSRHVPRDVSRAHPAPSRTSPAGMYLSQRPTGYSVTPSPRPSPSMGVGGGNFPRGVGGLSEVRRTQVAGSGDGGKK